MQLLEFPSCPFAEHSLQMALQRLQFSSAESTEVLHPATYLQAHPLTQVFQTGGVVLSYQSPASHLLPYLLSRPIADRRAEVHKGFTPTILRRSWAKGIA